jgi:uncharacterized protein involved in exopolysaccharide biosynthesis/Mrp family chromosome partitioning ATPase
MPPSRQAASEKAHAALSTLLAIDPISGVDAQVPGEGLGIRDILASLRRLAPAAVLSGIIVALGTGAYVSTLPRTYIGYAQVLHEPGASQLLSQDVARRDGGSETARMESQLHVLRSERVAVAVIQRLGLLQDPDFQRDEDEERLTASSFFASVRGALSIFRGTGSEGGTGAPAPSSGLGDPMRVAVASFTDRLAVRRVGQSFVLEIAFRANTPDRAAELANATAAAYVSEGLRAKIDVVRSSSVWLEERVEELRLRAVEALRAHERFRATGSPGLLSDARVQAADLETVSQTARRVYEAFLGRLSEMMQLSSSPIADARIISSAQVPLTHSDPKITITTLFAGLVGAGFGAVAALARDAMDQRLRNRRQLNGLGLPLLGLSRRAHRNRARRPQGLGTQPGSKAVANVAFGGLDDRALAELRQLRATVNRALGDTRIRCVGVTPVDGQQDGGKLALRLAGLSTLVGERVLLVDGDGRGAGVAFDFLGDTKEGLMELLDRGTGFEDLVVRVADASLFVLPRGGAGQFISPGDRSGDALAKVLDSFRTGFDMTIMSLPPVLMEPDARAIGPMLDGVVLVAVAGQTTRDDLAAAVTQLRSTGTSVLGVVVEDLRPGVSFP